MIRNSILCIMTICVLCASCNNICKRQLDIEKKVSAEDFTRNLFDEIWKNDSSYIQRFLDNSEDNNVRHFLVKFNSIDSLNYVVDVGLFGWGLNTNRLCKDKMFSYWLDGDVPESLFDCSDSFDSSQKIKIPEEYYVVLFDDSIFMWDDSHYWRLLYNATNNQFDFQNVVEGIGIEP